MLDFLNICRALGDENRLRILMALREREMCVCQVTAFLDLAPSTTSKHLSILKQARLIESSKQGRWVYYRLTESETRANAREALAWMRHTLSDESVIHADEARIRAIIQAEAAMPERNEICCHSLELHSLEQLESDTPSNAMETGND